MSVYNDMANDAGEPYGTTGNEQLAEDAEGIHRDRSDDAYQDYLYECWLEEKGHAECPVHDTEVDDDQAPED